MRVAGLLFLAGAVSASNNMKCGECVAVVEPLLTKITANPDKDTFKNDLKWLCHSIKGDNMEHCTNLAKKFGDDIYDAVTSENAAAMVCAVIEQCKAGDKMHLDYNFGCEDCKSKMKNFASFASYHSSAITKKLEKNICSGMSSGTKSNCKDMIKQFMPLLTFMVKNFNMGYMYCSAVDVCPVKSFQWTEHMSSPIESLASFSASPDIGCTTCETAVKGMRFAMKITGNSIDSSMCKKLFIASKQCADFFTLYAEDVIAAINEGKTDKEICTSVLSMCGEAGDSTLLHIISFVKAQVPQVKSYMQSSAYSSSSYESSESSSSSSESFEVEEYPLVTRGLKEGDSKTLKCRKCIATVDLMRVMVDLTDTAFDSSAVCKQIPILGVMCTSFMKTNANIIYDSLKNKLNDEEICVGKLGMCQPQDFPKPAKLVRAYNKPLAGFYYHYLETEN